LQVCVSERIFLGDHYLPYFFLDTYKFAESLSAKSEDFFNRCWELQCTGRIFVDLSLEKPAVFIQTIQNKLLSTEFYTKRDLSGMALLNEYEKQMIYFLVNLSIKYNPPIHALQVIKTGLMYQKSILQEEGMQKYVFSLNEEFHQYPSSLQMYCLDDLVRIQKNESNPGSKGIHHSVSYTIARQNLLDDILSIFNNVSIPPESNRPAHWCVILCKNKQLISIFKDKCKWPE